MSNLKENAPEMEKEIREAAKRAVLGKINWLRDDLKIAATEENRMQERLDRVVQQRQKLEAELARLEAFMAEGEQE